MSVFSLNNLDYYPGDVVELPETYLGESWLEPVKEPKKQEHKDQPVKNVREQRIKEEHVKADERTVLEVMSEDTGILRTSKLKRRRG